MAVLLNCGIVPGIARAACIQKWQQKCSLEVLQRFKAHKALHNVRQSLGKGSAKAGTYRCCSRVIITHAAQVHAYRHRVQFTAAAAQVPKNAILLEVGPHSVLRSPLRQCRPELPYVTAIKKQSDASLTVPDAVCELWRKGAAFSWPVDEACPLQERKYLIPWISEGAIAGHVCTLAFQRL